MSLAIGRDLTWPIAEVGTAMVMPKAAIADNESAFIWLSLASTCPIFNIIPIWGLATAYVHAWVGNRTPPAIVAIS